jgi:hypothetical protein
VTTVLNQEYDWFSLEVFFRAFPCFFLSCKANARVKLAKMGHGPHSCSVVNLCCSAIIVLFSYYCVVQLFLCCSVIIVLFSYYCVVQLLFILFYVLFVCKWALNHCHGVFTQLQFTNISYHISYQITLSINTRWIWLSFGINSLGHAVLVVQLVEAFQYKPKGRDFDSRWCYWKFSLPYSFRFLIEISTRHISWRIKMGGE